MKKLLCIIAAAFLIVVSLTACGANQEKAAKEKLSLAKIQEICNLSTLECYFHNVAKANKDSNADKTVFDILKKKRQVWIEYNGVVKLGINASKVKVENLGDTIEITIPEAEIIDVYTDDDTLNNATFYISEDDWLVPNVVTADLQSEAIQFAQEEMRNNVQNNPSLKKNAQIRAQLLIKNYIDHLSTESGTSYKIIWKYEDGTTSDQIPEEEDVGTTGQ
ncbi:MAG: DUF4230 domain-containing protein [Lachnospiraceae bacterium]|nr:DUF4230 domain-containing protein [Lachnospiraceae bacterium]